MHMCRCTVSAVSLRLNNTSAEHVSVQCRARLSTSRGVPWNAVAIIAAPCLTLCCCRYLCSSIEEFSKKTGLSQAFLGIVVSPPELTQPGALSPVPSARCPQPGAPDVCSCLQHSFCFRRSSCRFQQSVILIIDQHTACLPACRGIR
jgi:hypothetical protein